MRRLESVLSAAVRLISHKKKFDTSLLCRGMNYTGFPFVSVSISRPQSSSTTPSMVEVNISQHISAAPVFLSPRSAPGLTCDLLYEVTQLCLKPRLVSSSQEASMSLERLCGTRCLKTFRNPELSLDCFKSMFKTHLLA